MILPFKAVEITRFIVQGPDNYQVTVNSLSEAHNMADRLNEVYELGKLTALNSINAKGKEPRA